MSQVSIGTASSTTKEFQPVKVTERIESIDVVRGIALLGILVVNSLFFAMPMIVGMNRPGFGSEELVTNPFEWSAWWIMSMFFQYKFISLFSMLFGVGAAIQFDRARATGRSFDGFFLKRMVILLGFGVIHALLFWYGDILTVYAILGISFLALCRLKNVTLVILGLLFLFFGATLSAAMFTLEQFAPPLPEMTGDLPDTWFGVLNAAQWNPNNPIWILGETRAYAEGPYGDLFAFRTISWLMVVISAIVGFGWHVLAMFCFGVALLRAQFFGEGGRGLRRLAITVALPIGLLMEGTATLLTAISGEDWPLGRGLASVIHEFGSVVLALGYAGVIVWLVRRGTLKWFARIAACTGRMALSVYLLETVIMTSVFYHYGLGFFGQVDRIWLILISLVTWAVLAAFSTLWLANYRQGPMEWLWRRLAYGRASGRG
jgi:uncharacterized protein